MVYDPTVDGPVRAKGAPPAPRPKDAATLILVRRDRGRAEVLMGQRHADHSFMPNKFVFPGGRVDRTDTAVPAAGELRPRVAVHLELGATRSRARALAIAAIRETFEETGLRLARPAPRLPHRGDWAAFAAPGVAPSLDVLEFVARAITPPYRPKRFDARFFMADAHHLHDTDLDALQGSGELLTLRWVTTEEARDLDLPNITKLVVTEIAARLATPDHPRPIPFTRFRHGKALRETIGP